MLGVVGCHCHHAHVMFCVLVVGMGHCCGCLSLFMLVGYDWSLL